MVIPVGDSFLFGFTFYYTLLSILSSSDLVYEFPAFPMLTSVVSIFHSLYEAVQFFFLYVFIRIPDFLLAFFPCPFVSCVWLCLVLGESILYILSGRSDERVVGYRCRLFLLCPWYMQFSSFSVTLDELFISFAGIILLYTKSCIFVLDCHSILVLYIVIFED